MQQIIIKIPKINVPELFVPHLIKNIKCQGCNSGGTVKSHHFQGTLVSALFLFKCSIGATSSAVKILQPTFSELSLFPNVYLPWLRGWQVLGWGVGVCVSHSKEEGFFFLMCLFLYYLFWWTALCVL